MVRITWSTRLLGLPLALCLLLAGCAPLSVPATAPPEAPLATATVVTLTPEAIPTTAASQTEPAPALAPDANTPEDVAQLFFAAYVEAFREPGNPLLRADFAARQYLSPDFLAQVAEIRAGFEGAGFDPVLHAQDIPPGSVEVAESWVAGDEATVVLRWDDPAIAGGWTRTVYLAQLDGAWKIVPDQVDGGALDAESTVEAFYAWYLDLASDGVNPLVDQAFHAAPYLTGELRSKVDEILAGFAEQDQGGYDPFLCAQDIPAGFDATTSYYNGGRPAVLLQSSFPGHYLALDLVRADFNRWAIRDITCGATPAGLAKALYTSAQGYANEKGRHYWSERAYRDSPFLTPAFIEQLDAQVEGGLDTDPLLLAQTPPLAFNTAACGEPDCALVNLQFGDSTVQQVRLALEREDGRLRVSGVSRPAALEPPQPEAVVPGVEQWVPYRDEQFGFALRYPAEWHVTGLKVTDRHTPAEYPVMHSLWLGAAPGVGQPARVTIEVVVGDQAVFDAQFGWLTQVEKREINGQPAQVLRSDNDWLYYAFQPPARPGTWVVVVDLTASHPDLAALEASLPEMMLSTLVLAE